MSNKPNSGLPDGWIICVSQRRNPDQRYYFNVNTGERSWRHPVTKEKTGKKRSFPASASQRSSDVVSNSDRVVTTSVNSLLYGGDTPSNVSVDRITSWLKGVQDVEKDDVRETQHVKNPENFKRKCISSPPKPSSAGKKRKQSSEQSCSGSSDPLSLFSPNSAERFVSPTRSPLKAKKKPSSRSSPSPKGLTSLPSVPLKNVKEKADKEVGIRNISSKQLTGTEISTGKQIFTKKVKTAISKVSQTPVGKQNVENSSCVGYTSRKLEASTRKWRKQQQAQERNKERKNCPRIQNPIVINKTVKHIQKDSDTDNCNTKVAGEMKQGKCNMRKKEHDIQTGRLALTQVSKIELVTHARKVAAATPSPRNTRSSSSSDVITSTMVSCDNKPKPTSTQQTSRFAIPADRTTQILPGGTHQQVRLDFHVQSDGNISSVLCRQEGTSSVSSQEHMDVTVGDYMPVGYFRNDVNYTSDTDEVVAMEVDPPDEKAQIVTAELQEIRENIKISPQQKCGKLTSMEQHQVGHQQSPTVLQDKLYIIVDTNVLISHLKFLDEFKDHSFKGCGKPVLVIPWVVMQELDSLKNRKKGRVDMTVDISQKARQAVTFLHSCLQNGHPRIKGQSMMEASVKVKSLKTESNDDRVLQCCLQYQEKVPGTTVVLFSGDKNLCNKAIVSNVPALTKEGLLRGIRDLFEDVYPNSSSSVPPLQPVSYDAPPLPSASYAALQSACNIVPPPVKMSVPSQVRTIVAPQVKIHTRRPASAAITPPPETVVTSAISTAVTPPVKTVVSSTASTSEINKSEKLMARTKQKEVADDILCRFKTVLRDSLSVVLETEMKIIYKDLWYDIVYRKPPWTLRDVLECFNKHWFAVFGMVTDRGSKQYVEKLILLARRKTSFGLSVHQVKEVIRDGYELLSALEKGYSYNQLCSAKETIEKLQQECKTSNAVTVVDKSPVSKQKKVHMQTGGQGHVLEVFQVIWQAINYYTSLIFENIGYSDPSFPPIMTDLKPNRAETVELLSTLCVQVELLSTALVNVLNVPVTDLQQRGDIFIILSQALYSFIRNVQVDIDCQLTPEMLYECSIHDEYRKSLLNGQGQLTSVLNKLKDNAASLTMSQR